MEPPKTYNYNVGRKLDELDQHIEHFSARAEEIPAQARQEFEIQLAMLRARQSAVHHQLQQLIDRGDEATDDLRTGLERAMNDLTEVLAAASSRVNRPEGDYSLVKS